MTKPSTPTKTDLYRMLAEAVRNTQPQPANPPPEPARNNQPAPKRASPPRNTRSTKKRAAKTKRIRASVSGKLKPR
jgi:hypothetical protein